MAQSLVDELEGKNKLLEQELQVLRGLFQNLHEEKDLESPDQRRAFMLKAQNYQLERQCMLLSQAQSSRALVLGEIECQLQRVTSDFEALVSEEKAGPNVVIKRARVMVFLGTLKKLKNSLYRQSQLESPESLNVPSLMSGSKFAKVQKPLGCMCICMPKSPLENLNLKHIASLEQELSSMYKRLSQLSFALDSSTLGRKSFIASEHQALKLGDRFFSPSIKKIQQESEKCISDLHHCCDQLVALSLLHPSAPWSAVRKSDRFDDINFEKAVRCLPSNVQKNLQVRAVIQDICKAHNYVVHTNRLRQNAMQTQLDYHKSTAKIQQRYLAELSSAVMRSYSLWKEDTADSICKPVAKVLRSWEVLKDDQSSEHLKKFLADFKCCESELEKVSVIGSSNGADRDELFAQLTSQLDEDLALITAQFEAKMSEIDKTLTQHKET